LFNVDSSKNFALT
jgi:hypothetical protein